MIGVFYFINGFMIFYIIEMFEILVFKYLGMEKVLIDCDKFIF